MSLPTTEMSYTDCFDVLDACLAADRGVRVKMPDHDRATFFRMRVHQARQIIRNKNKVVYERDHAMWGCSQYDPIAVKIRIEDGTVWVYLEKISSVDLVIEPIEGPIPQIEHKSQLRIAGPEGTIQGEVLPPIRRV